MKNYAPSINRLVILIAALVSSQPLTNAEITELGTGLCYGGGHAYFLTAPAGWVLDNESGREQGVYATFYPKGSSWNGPAVAYSNAAGREGRAPTAAINHDIEEMRSKNPKIKVMDAGTLKTSDNRTALLKTFTGDSFGNSEMVAYIVEKNVVVNIVLTARSDKDYKAALPSFRKLVMSYRFITDDPSKINLEDKLKSERAKASTSVKNAKPKTR